MEIHFLLPAIVGKGELHLVIRAHLSLFFDAKIIERRNVLQRLHLSSFIGHLTLHPDRSGSLIKLPGCHYPGSGFLILLDKCQHSSCLVALIFHIHESEHITRCCYDMLVAMLFIRSVIA